MLVISFSDGFDTEWRVSEKNPLDVIYEYVNNLEEREYNIALSRTLDKVFMIQADGDELLHIMNQYTRKYGDENTQPYVLSFDIPIPTGKSVVRWYGDIARTILLNL